jgi:hypothetical protein
MLLCVVTHTHEFPVFILFLQFRCDDFFDGLLTPVIHPYPSERMVFDVNYVGVIWILMTNQRMRRLLLRPLLPFVVFLCSCVDTISSGRLPFSSRRHRHKISDTLHRDIFIPTGLRTPQNDRLDRSDRKKTRNSSFHA